MCKVLKVNKSSYYHWIKAGSKIHKTDTKLNELIEFIFIEGKNTTDSNHNLPIAPNVLNQDFYASNLNEKYVGDITYIPTGEGWLYLATVIDLYSRKIVGWSMDDTMKVSLVNDALNKALKHRKPSSGLIWHTDRGSQYASYSHRDLLKGNCWDNAVAESFFKSLKNELVYQTSFYTKIQARQEIWDCKLNCVNHL